MRAKDSAEESNPRRRSADDDSEGDADLAPPGAAETPQKQRHKRPKSARRRGASKSDELPFVHPGQLRLDDVLGGGDDGAQD
jgi:hypothetical protein